MDATIRNEVSYLCGYMDDLHYDHILYGAVKMSHYVSNKYLQDPPPPPPLDRYDTYDDDFDSDFEYYEFKPYCSHNPKDIAYLVNFEDCNAEFGRFPKTSAMFDDICDDQRLRYEVFETEELAWKNIDSIIDMVFQKVRDRKILKGRKVPEFGDFYRRWRPKFSLEKVWSLEKQREINKLVAYKKYWDRKKKEGKKVKEQ